jgi:hypothetical protein
MRPDGSVHLAMVDRLVEHYAADGADGLFVCGTTGESVSLSTDERMQLAARWCEAAGGVGRPLPVGVNVTHTSLPECRALAAHAARRRRGRHRGDGVLLQAGPRRGARGVPRRRRGAAPALPFSTTTTRG